MSSIVIKVENLGKKYIIGHQTNQRYVALRDVIANKAKQAAKLLNPKHYRNSNNPNPSVEEFWALKDINFEINQGDRVGIIGRNGAGKSTLLKVLSRITEPTTGSVKIKGRVASLLEVGTGFHPELTGRENIYLNGGILGMSRVEIKKKFDEIVAFAEVEKFLDTPVKRFSSGMYVRLAFAIAAHLEPEILVVDEVLAVGDAEFQKKCLGKMEDVSKNEGRTVLFVSHNMATIKNICTNCILLQRGEILAHGNSNEVIEQYLSKLEYWENTSWVGKHNENDQVVINKIYLNSKDNTKSNLDIDDDLILSIDTYMKCRVSGIAFEIFVKTIDEIMVFSSYTEGQTFEKGNVKVICEIPKRLLNNCKYSITVGISKNNSVWIVHIKDAITFELMNVINLLGWQGEIPGVIRPTINWQIIGEII
jgi:lipopolysaccharide transport system ATP-binding protein